jgi:hypothetical protein
MGANEVALAAITLAASTVAGLIWVVKYLAKTLTVGLKEHTQAAQSQTKASKEVLKFMKNLNGKLENAYIEKAKE